MVGSYRRKGSSRSKRVQYAAKVTRRGGKRSKELDAIHKDLQAILKNQRTMLSEENTVLNDEKTLKSDEREIKAEEKQNLAGERAQSEEIAQLERVEQEIAEQVKVPPLSRITLRDFTKSIVGALFGIVGDFTFFNGTVIAANENFTVSRAIVLYLVSFLIAFIFMYFAGFRKTDWKDMKYMPLRVLVVYGTSIMVIVIVLLIFGFISHQTSLLYLFKSVSAISILAVLGAATADLIGKE